MSISSLKDVSTNSTSLITSAVAAGAAFPLGESGDDSRRGTSCVTEAMAGESQSRPVHGMTGGKWGEPKGSLVPVLAELERFYFAYRVWFNQKLPRPVITIQSPPSRRSV